MKNELERLKSSNVAAKAAPVLLSQASPLNRLGYPEMSFGDQDGDDPMGGESGVAEVGVDLVTDSLIGEDDVNKIVEDALREEEMKVETAKREDVKLKAPVNGRRSSNK